MPTKYRICRYGANTWTLSQGEEEDIPILSTDEISEESFKATVERMFDIKFDEAFPELTVLADPNDFVQNGTLIYNPGSKCIRFLA